MVLIGSSLKLSNILKSMKIWALIFWAFLLWGNPTFI
jgi:hypothetical protein